jgi:protoporphyrinogen oxidase
MTTKIKYLILGAGPSGLALATQLLRMKETSFIIVDKDAEAGGLCKSRQMDGSPLDIGGGHLLDVRRKNILDFVFHFLPANEWNRFDRISKIQFDGVELDYPYEAHIWQLPMDDQVAHLLSIMNAGSNRGTPMPKSFSKWISWKLGDLIANHYLLPYNAKIFADISLDELGTYWLYKLPNVSMEDTLRSCLSKKIHGHLPAHAQFYYPKQHGYGEVFKRMGAALGKNLLLNYPVKSLDVETLTVNNEIQAEMVISTLPWQELAADKSFPKQIKTAISRLKYSSIDVTYRPEKAATDSHWTYFPSPELSYHRVLYRQNLLAGAKGYVEETNTLRLPPGEISTHHNQYAYPLNTIHKPEQIQKVLAWATSRSIIGLGRWGEWEHMNSDVALEKGINLAVDLLQK